MLNVKIYRILNQIDAIDRNRFEKYVKSPYFNVNDDLTSLLEIYLEHIKQSRTELTKEEIWHSVYTTKKAYNDTKFRQLNTKLLALFEDFIAQEKYNKSPFLKTILQLEQVSNEEFELLENQIIKHSKTLSKRFEEMSSEYHLNMFQIEKSYFYLTSDLEKKSKRKSKIEKFNFQRILNHLDIFYLAEKLRFLYTQLFWESYSAAEKSDLLNDEILELVKKGRFRKDPLLLSLYYCIRTLIDSDNEGYYQKLKESIQTNLSSFSRDYQRFFYDCLFTYTIRQANQGKSQYHEEIVELYKEALHRDLIVENDVLSPVTYRNVVLYSLRTKQFEWAENFIKEYAQYLPDEERENAVSFNLARIYFYQNDFEAALLTLNQVDLEDIHYTLNARTLLVAVYYELKEYDALLSSIDSFRVYLNRTKILSKGRLDNFKNYLKYTKRMAFIESSNRTKIAKLYQEVSDNSAVNKQWILEKITELGYKPISV